MLTAVSPCVALCGLSAFTALTWANWIRASDSVLPHFHILQFWTLENVIKYEDVFNIFNEIIFFLVVMKSFIQNFPLLENIFLSKFEVCLIISVEQSYDIFSCLDIFMLQIFLNKTLLLCLKFWANFHILSHLLQIVSYLHNADVIIPWFEFKTNTNKGKKKEVTCAMCIISCLLLDNLNLNLNALISNRPELIDSVAYLARGLKHWNISLNEMAAHSNTKTKNRKQSFYFDRL